jgi:hypothetical protein
MFSSILYYHNFGHNHHPAFYFKTGRFEDWILSPSSCGTFQYWTNRMSTSLCPETETSSLYWFHLSRFQLKTETESSLRNAFF